jgi:hypothetical protein
MGLTRRKLAFGPPELGEFFLVIEVAGSRSSTAPSPRCRPARGRSKGSTRP